MKKYLYKDLYRLEDQHWWHISKRKAVAYLIKKYAQKKILNILDIGCGTGKNMEVFQKFGTVYGLDSSPEALRFCNRRGLKNLKLGSAENTALKTNSFDIVTLLDVLEHTDDNKTLKEIRRILKKNGMIIITVPAFTWLWSKWDEVLHHKRRYTMKNLRDLLLENKFHPIKITYLYSFLILPILFTRKIKEIFFRKFYPSDFKLSNNPLNYFFNNISKLEFYIAKKLSIPVGTTILVIAKKNDQ